MLSSTIIRVEHLCCGMESKLIREVLAPLETVVDVKISLTDRRVNVEHKNELAPETIVDMLNAKHLGASLQDRSVVETVGGSFNHVETARLTVNLTQLLLLAATLAASWLGHHRLAHGMGLTCVALSVSLFHEAYLSLRRRRPNVELMMAIAMGGALAQGEIVEAATVGALVSLMDLVKVFALEAVGRQLRGSVVTEPLSVDIPGGGKVLLSELAVGDVYKLRVGDVRIRTPSRPIVHYRPTLGAAPSTLGPTPSPPYGRAGGACRWHGRRRHGVAYSCGSNHGPSRPPPGRPTVW